MLGFTRSRITYQYSKCAQQLRKYHKLSYIHNPGTEPLRSLTIGKLLEQSVEKYGDRLAIISRAQKESLTFHEVLKQADKLAAGFKAIGLNSGDRVGIWAPNLVEWYLGHMACARGGYVLVSINPAFQPSEIKSCINGVGVKSVICTHRFKTQNYYDILNKISPSISQSEPGKLQCKEMPTLKSIIISSDETPRGTFNFEEILHLATTTSINDIRKIQDSIDPDSLCHLQLTSGTTGKPKAPMQTHFQIVNNSYFIGKSNELDRKHQRICLQMPLFHVAGTVAAINGALNHGATLVLPTPGYDPDKSLDAIRDEKCTIIFGTPTMFVDLVNTQKRRKEDISPEIAVSGGASCSPHLFREMKEFLNLKKVKSVYGLTEVTGGCFHSLYDEDEYQSTSTVGYISDHLEAKVVDQKGKIVPRGTPGELCLRGYSMTLGYWQDFDKTRELIDETRWLRTGDQFILEENGYGRIVGRIKEMINRGGENIFPKEIEDVLNTHPHILEAYVVGIPHERLGEEICACIRIKKNVSVSLDDVNSYFKGKIAHFKLPSLIKVMDSFPKTSSGKIQKYKLVEILMNEK